MEFAPRDTPIVSFPEFLPPGSTGHSPEITESCMTTYHTEESRATFMCNYSKMVLKKNGRMRVYACTLVDDDEAYDLGGLAIRKHEGAGHVAASSLLHLFRVWGQLQ